MNKKDPEDRVGSGTQNDQEWWSQTGNKSFQMFLDLGSQPKLKIHTLQVQDSYSPFLFFLLMLWRSLFPKNVDVQDLLMSIPLFYEKHNQQNYWAIRRIFFKISQVYTKPGHTFGDYYLLYRKIPQHSFSSAEDLATSLFLPDPCTHWQLFVFCTNVWSLRQLQVLNKLCLSRLATYNCSHLKTVAVGEQSEIIIRFWEQNKESRKTKVSQRSKY